MKQTWIGIVTERFRRHVYTNVLVVMADTREDAVRQVDNRCSNSPLTGARRIERTVHLAESLTAIPVSVSQDGTIFGNGQ